MKSMDSAPKNEPLDDYGPPIVLFLSDEETVVGRYCSGLELSDLWIPPGWYCDGEEIYPIGWQPF